MAATQKISVTLGREELRRAKLLAARRRLSLSSVITEAVRDHVDAQARREAGEAVLRTFDVQDRASPGEMRALLDRWASPAPSAATVRTRARPRRRSRA